MSEFQPLPEQDIPEALAPHVILAHTQAIDARITQILSLYHGEQTVAYAQLETDIMNSIVDDFEPELLDAYIDTMVASGNIEGPQTATAKTAAAVRNIIKQITGHIDEYSLENVEARHFVVSRLHESGRDSTMNTLLHVTSDGTKTGVAKFELYLDPDIDEPRFDQVNLTNRDIEIVTEVADRLDSVLHYLDVLTEQSPEALRAEIDLYRQD